MLATQGCHHRFLAGRGTQNVDMWLTHAGGFQEGSLDAPFMEPLPSSRA